MNRKQAQWNKQFAREMRHDPTPAEHLLWQALRRHQFLNLHFRRQHPIEQFIVDFVCLSHRVIIEVDGEIHDVPEQAKYDQERQAYLESLWFLVLRFPNEAIFADLQKVLKHIVEALPTAPPP